MNVLPAEHIETPMFRTWNTPIVPLTRPESNLRKSLGLNAQTSRRRTGAGTYLAHKHVMTLKLDGTLDQETAPEVRLLLFKMIDASDNTFVADLSGVEAVDSAGIAILIEALRHAQLRGSRFGLLNPSRTVTNILDVSRLSGFFPVDNRVESSQRRAG